MLAVDVATLAPTGGVAGLVAVLMGMQYRSNSDNRKNEISLRSEFAADKAARRVEFETDKAAIRKEFLDLREADRIEIASLRAQIDKLRDRLDELRR